MSVLLLGIGRQGRAALYDLVHSSDFEEIIAVDVSSERVKWAKKHFNDQRVTVRRTDITKHEELENLLREFEKGIVIDLLPIDYIPFVSKTVVQHG